MPSVEDLSESIGATDEDVEVVNCRVEDDFLVVMDSGLLAMWRSVFLKIL